MNPIAAWSWIAADGRREQVVELRLDRLGPAEERVQEAHVPQCRAGPGPTWPSSRWILVSSSIRFSSVGWVEKRFASDLPFSFSAGAK